ARMADKFVFIRSLVDCDGQHDAYQCMTGRKKTAQQAAFWPALGGWVSRVQGPVNPAMPPHLSLMYDVGGWGYPGGGGFLGMAHNPFRLTAPGRDVNQTPTGLTLNVPLERLHDRVRLRRAFDGLDRQLDRGGLMDGLDAFGQQALGILTS